MTDRIADPVLLATEVVASEIELVVCATDMTERATPAGDRHAFELVYSSREHSPEVLAKAILASAAMSGLVPPQRIGDRIATDGGWTRNFPLGHAYDRPEVQQIVAFRSSSAIRRLTSTRSWPSAAGSSASGGSRRSARSSRSCARRRSGRAAASPRTRSTRSSG